MPSCVYKQGDGLRADALKAEQVENRRRKLLEQVAVIPGARRSSAISRILAARSLPMPGIARSCSSVQCGQPLGGVRDRVGGVAVRANLERVLALDLEQVGDLGEDARDGEVVHESAKGPKFERSGRPLFQAEHLNPPVLPEMMVEGEGSRDVTGVQHGERDGIAQGPVLVGVSSQDVLGSLLFRGKGRHDRQAACQQPLTGHRPPELP